MIQVNLKDGVQDINCIPACQLIQADLASSTPQVSPIDTGWIDICIGDRVTFEGAGIYPQNDLAYHQSDQTSDFEWDFGDGGLAYNPSVSHVYTKPGGYTVQLQIKDQLGCVNSNFISQRIRVSDKPNFNITDLPGTYLCW